MKTSEQTKKQLDHLEAKQRELHAERADLQRAVSKDEKARSIAIVASQDTQAITARLDANCARLAVLAGAIEEADRQAEELRAQLADALDLEALADFQKQYPELCKRLADADAQRQALMMGLEAMASDFARQANKLRGPKSAVAQSTAAYCSRSLTAITGYLMNAGVYFDAIHDVQEKRMERIA